VVWSVHQEVSEQRRSKIGIMVMCTGCVQTRGSSHEESDPSCIGIPLVVIFGYSLLGTYGRIYWGKLRVFGGLDHWGQGYELGAQWLDRTAGRAYIVTWTLCNANEEEKAWDRLWCGRGV
jgi:hypothetical protein